MSGKTLRELAGSLAGAELSGSIDTPISGIAYDSRDVTAGSVFVALDGLHTDGHAFVADAVRRGAVAVVHSKRIVEQAAGIGVARVADTRAALSPLSAAYYDYPSRRLGVIGVTGTDGKSQRSGSSSNCWRRSESTAAFSPPSTFRPEPRS